MGRQRNMFQMKEQNKVPKKELSKMELSNLPDAEFKMLVIRILSDLSESFNKETGNIQMEIEDIKRTI